MIKLTITKSKSDKYYYAQMSVRKGKTVSSETIERIGKHSELLKITDDPEGYANARVEQLDQQYRTARAPLNYAVDFSKKIEPIKGEAPSPLDVPVGCPFQDRCPHCMAVCREKSPALRQLEPGHEVACHLFDQGGAK